MPRLELGCATGGGTAPAAEGVIGEVIGTVRGGAGVAAGVGVGAGVGVRGVGAVATRGVCGVSTRVVIPEGLGVGVTAVVPDAGNGETGTVLKAARNAAAD